MAVYAVILFAIATSSVALGHVHRNIDKDFTIEHLIGTWYTDAIINPEFDSSLVFECDKTKITDDDYKITNNVHTEVTINGAHMKFDGVGHVVDSVLYIWYPALGIHGSKFGVSFFTHQREMILHDGDDVHYYLLLSREKNPSETIKQAFRNLAASNNADVKWVQQANCDLRITH